MNIGSSGLLQKNQLLHKSAVEIVFTKANQKLKCHQTNEINRENIKAILSVKKLKANHNIQTIINLSS